MRRCLLISLLAVLASACAGLNPTLDTARAIWGATPNIPFAKGFEYLEVSVDGRRTVMALGSRQKHGGMTVEQWFSGQGEMLELHDGRVQRALGMTWEIRRTSGPSLPWDELDMGSQGTSWQRVREVMPGYQERQERVISRRLALPAQALRVDAEHWIEEQVATRQPNGRDWRYRDRFGLRGGKVVYSEQCVGPDLCLALKPLGVVNP